MTAHTPNIPAQGFNYYPNTTPPCTFTTILYPYVGASPPEINVKPLLSSVESGHTALKLTNGNTSDYIFISRTGPTEASFANLNITAEVLVLKTENNKPTVIAGRNVSKVIFARNSLLDRPEPVEGLHLDMTSKGSK